MEPISPELVLVDPELARAARARLPELPPHAAPAAVKTSATVVEPSPPLLAEEVRPQLTPAAVRKPRHTALSPVLLLISVFVNIVLISLAVSDAGGDQPSSTSSVPLGGAIPQGAPVVPPTTSHRPRAAGTPAAGRKASSQSRKRATKGNPAKAVRETTGAVERKLLAVVVRSPTGKLPPSLIDRRTGLAKNGLQAICNHSGARSFVCIVTPTHHKPREGLYVRYRPGQKGRDVFTWYPYRSG